MLKYMRIATCLAVIAAMTGSALAQGAAKPAAKGLEIVIDDPGWENLTAAQRAELVDKLKAANAIGKDDTIVYKGQPDNRVTERNTNPLTALPALGSAICRGVNLMRRSACGKIDDSAQRKTCQDEEKARYSSNSVRSACGG